MNVLRKMVSPFYRDTSAPFTRQPDSWAPPDGYDLLHVRGDKRVTLPEMLTNEASMRKVLGSAAQAARLDRGLTNVLVNVAGMALLDRTAKDMPALEAGVKSILDRDPEAEIQLHIDIPDPQGVHRNVMVVFHLHTCLFPDTP